MVEEMEEEAVVATKGRWRSKGTGGSERRGGGRVSSSCNAINPVAVHHVDTILVDSFQPARVVGVGFCAITSLGPTLHTQTRPRSSHVASSEQASK